MNIILWLKDNWRWVIGIAALIASFFTGWKYGAGSVQARWDKEQANEMKILNDALTANDTTLDQLAQEKKNAETIIDGFMSRNPDRVRLPKPSGCSQIAPTIGSEVSKPADRDILGEAESILGEDRRRTQEIIGSAERELTECRVVKEWAASLSE